MAFCARELLLIVSVALLAEGVDIHYHCLASGSAVRNSRNLPMI